VSIFDEGDGAGTAMPPSFPIETQTTEWTASATAVETGQFFVIDDMGGDWTLAADSTEFGARCVRGPTLPSTSTTTADTVTMDLTGLMWPTTGGDDTLRTWGEALDYCESFSYAGKDDWRLPSIKELATIIDETALVAPVLDADLGAVTAPALWSSFAFAVDTNLGISPSLKMVDKAAAVRCVRTAD
jgi:hypothetical protein